MKDTEPIYITGHQHPDTDSVASAIAYAFFKRAKGIKAIPCRLGPLNNETNYLLKRFGFEAPMLLDDARKQIREIEIDPPDFITPETTVFETLQLMNSLDRQSFAVLDDNYHIVGFVSTSDLAKIGLGETAAEIELRKNTSVDHIAEAINGTILYDDVQSHINGKVSIISLSKNRTSNYDVKDRIVIIGDDPDSQLDLIANKGAGLLIVVWCDNLREDVMEAAKKYHCPIIKSGHGSMNTSRFLYLAPPVKLIMKMPHVFKDTELVEDAAEMMMKTRYRNYPVVNKDGRLAGYINRFHIMNYRNKKIILVDHNEFAQSVRAVEKAQILEVVDHHRISDFATSQPVSFRNEIVGSTATIITTMFRENQIPMPQNLAGLLLGAVLSDTLMFQSPTTTPRDRDVANILAALADLDIETFGNEMFGATASAADKSIHEMLIQDIKYFDIAGNHVMISQVLVTSARDMRNRRAEIMSEMNDLVRRKELDLLVVAFSSILENGSVIFLAGERAVRAAAAFPDKDGEQNSLQVGILSRKTQILPKISAALGA